MKESAKFLTYPLSLSLSPEIVNKKPDKFTLERNGGIKNQT
jgi:hypothetical protein